MTKVHERVHLGCPYGLARKYLHEALEPASKSTLPKILRLHASVLKSDVTLAKHVRLHCAHADDAMHFNEVWQIGWTPEPGGIYPAFNGQLAVCAGDTYETAILQLDGEYRPPLGAAGAIFDAAIGHHVASATAQSLLAEIGAEMEARYNREEAAKKDAVL